MRSLLCFPITRDDSNKTPLSTTRIVSVAPDKTTGPRTFRATRRDESSALCEPRLRLGANRRTSAKNASRNIGRLEGWRERERSSGTLVRLARVYLLDGNTNARPYERPVRISVGSIPASRALKAIATEREMSFHDEARIRH